jgi:DNA-binding MarR family transcriptional regulator
VTAAAPLHLPCVCAATRRAARVLTGVYDQELRPVGVPATQFGLLAAIDRHPGATQEQLGTRLAMEQSTLSRNLKGLARKRWVAGHPEPGTPPVAHYATTAAGRAALRRARPAWQRAQARVKRALGADWHAMGRLLDKIATLPPP